MVNWNPILHEAEKQHGFSIAISVFIWSFVQLTISQFSRSNRLFTTTLTTVTIIRCIQLHRFTDTTIIPTSHPIVLLTLFATKISIVFEDLSRQSFFEPNWSLNSSNDIPISTILMILTRQYYKSPVWYSFVESPPLYCSRYLDASATELEGPPKDILYSSGLTVNWTLESSKSLVQRGLSFGQKRPENNDRLSRNLVLIKVKLKIQGEVQIERKRKKVSISNYLILEHHKSWDYESIQTMVGARSTAVPSLGKDIPTTSPQASSRRLW